MEYYSQYEQDKYLDKKVFKGKNRGVFVDIGAHDGISLSNTYFFEKHRQWTGICIEPIPNVYAKLKQNRACITVNGCIDNKSGVSKFLCVEGYGEMLSGLVDKYDPQHYERVQNAIQQHGSTAQEIEVQCYQLHDLLKSHQMDHVDYCSIDTEGNEFEILQSIEFEALDIDVFTVENPYDTSNIRKYMLSKNYELVKNIHCDDLFRRKKKLFWKFW